METIRELWDFIGHPEDPDYETKFENLIRLYADNAYAHPESFDSKNIRLFHEVVREENWLFKMHLPLRFEKVSLTRLRVFLIFADSIHMLDDYAALYGEGRESKERFFKAYQRLLEVHRRGFEEEKKEAAPRFIRYFLFLALLLIAFYIFACIDSR